MYNRIMWTSFIGFMASGKTTLVRHLQRATGRRAVDLDALIEEQAAASIPEIFAQRGEAAFRALELRALQSLPRDEALLVATGGGCVVERPAAALLRRCGVVIWLDASWEVLLKRLQASDAAARPLHAELGAQGLQDMYRQRCRLYAAAADFRLRGDQIGIPALARGALLKSLLWRRRQTAARVGEQA